MYPHTITIFNYVDIKGTLTYFKTVVSGVLYQDSQGFVIGNTNHVTNNMGYVQIPHEVGGYIPYDEWVKLQDKTGKWTLQSGHSILKGVTDKDKPKDTNARTIETFENVDYAIMLDNHYGVTLK